jgi:HK97 gp10 family phage protein
VGVAVPKEEEAEGAEAVITVKIHKGGAVAALDDIARTLGNERTVTEAIIEAAQPIAAAAKAEIPRGVVGPIRSADQITVWTEKGKLGFSSVFVGIPGPDVLGKASRAFIGRFLEFGTSKMKAHPWLRPAVDREGGASFMQRLAAILTRGMKRAA